MKNILLLIGSLSNGGAERSIINVANELSKYHNVLLVTANKKCDYNCNVKIIEINDFEHKIKKILGIYKLYKIKKQYNIDATISYTTAYNFYNVISKYKDKTIISIRNYLSKKNEGFKANLLHKLSLKLSNKIVCCSNGVLFDQLNNYKANKNKLCVIPNFYDEVLINNTIQSKIFDKNVLNSNTIISMGRLVPHKGHQFIIEAMNLVVKEIKDARLLIFGRGEYKNELEKLIKKYNLEENVILMGFNSEPYSYIKKSKAFVLASLYEGFPNVLIEAMACGTPVIATNSYGGVKEILTDNDITVDKMIETDYGILVPNIQKKEDIIELKNAIVKVLKNEQTYKYYSMKSTKRVRKYKSEKIIKQWLEVIK